ncbi:MAG TPA: hypothetical protein VN903_14145, partial [Polyangia bacterium]|nr:hypothetical protein [Polyangia bacterium]
MSKSPKTSSVCGGALAVLLAGFVTATGACNGNISPNKTGNATGTGGLGGSNVKPGDVTVPPTPISQDLAYVAVRKVKNLLIGMPPTDEDVALVTNSGAAGLQMLVSTWQTSDTTKLLFRDKMVGFFRNAFQQTGFTPTEDFKIQLLQNGGFDFGPFGTSAVGDDAFPRLVQNLQDSFALTAWQLFQEGHPFTEVLTTNKFVMTTALKSLYIQIEMPADAPFGNQNAKPAWTVDYSGTAIPLESALQNMVFSDEAPAAGRTNIGGGSFPTCAGGTGAATGTFNGTSLLFQRLLGFTPRYPFTGNGVMCYEHASKPYFIATDLTDWNWVTINHVATPSDRTNPPIKPYDLPMLRAATSLDLAMPRIGFYTTPAFLALWNTNDSNQHRVTANQTLLAALGQSFTSDSVIMPLSQDGLDYTHAVAGSECVGCHKSLDPMRQFWGTQLDFNDRNDFPAGNRFTGAAANPRPAQTGGGFAFGDVNDKGSDITAVGTFVAQVTDGAGLHRFAITMAQDLCYWANSAPCSESDTEFRRVVGAFENSSPMPYNFAALIKEFFASPLVTGVVATGTFSTAGAVPISISRRDHFCAALSNRLGKPDLCAQAVPRPSQTQATTATIAQSVATDAFSRGSQVPVTPSDPTLFYRSASELLCSNIAAQVVDPTSGTGVYSMSDVTGAKTGSGPNAINEGFQLELKRLGRGRLQFSLGHASHAQGNHRSGL